MAFEIEKGINASHWLSQSKQRGKEREQSFAQQDVEKIAEMGFDHIRLPIDEVQMWTEDGKKETEAFELLDSALQWCKDSHLKVIVDVHILRSHYFNDKETPRLFTDEKEQAYFADLWKDLSSHLSQYPVDEVAYEILNEAVAKDPRDWNKVSSRVFQAIREAEPERTIILGSNWFNSVDTFDALTIPEDNNCILTFHYYNPMLITHYTAKWWDGGSYNGPVNYPGAPIPTEEMEKMDAETKGKFQSWNKPYSRDVIIRDIEKPLKIREQTGKPLYCGEFGCIAPTPRESRLQWYKDIISVFSEYNIARANWDYKGGFGIFTPAGEEDKELINILLA